MVPQTTSAGMPDPEAARVARDRLAAFARSLTAPPGRPPDALTELVGRSFGTELLRALLTRQAAGSLGAGGARRLPLAPPVPPLAVSPVVTGRPARAGDPASSAGLRPLAARPREDEIIRRAAARAGVDEEFLTALRKIENGGPGREFGVLSVPAPTYEAQARVAAESVRRSRERFEATGASAVDPATGRYTEAFVRFFSSRYAPVGASNDPAGLNRHHAGNLVRRYAQLTRLA